MSGRRRNPNGQDYGKHPPHLRGRDIGLWYAKRNAQRRAISESICQISLTSQETEHLSNVLTSDRLVDEKYSRNYSSKSHNFSSGAEQPFLNSDDISSVNIKSDGFCSIPKIQINEADVSNQEVVETDCTLREFVNYQNYEHDRVASYDQIVLDGTYSVFDISERDAMLDEHFLQEFNQKLQNPNILKLLPFRKGLPVYEMKEKLISVIESNKVTIVCGDTGCGKSTQVPQFILDSYTSTGKGSTCRIVCTQPRRISAVALAERVSAERGEPCGRFTSVGYQIRLKRQMPRNRASILYCTTGILLQWLQYDQNLKGISHVFLDEVHEQDIQTDFLIIILRDLLQSNSNLHLILMSATIKSEQFAQYFGSCPLVTVPGRVFPVQELWLEDLLPLINLKIDEKKLVDSWHVNKYRRIAEKEFIQVDQYLSTLTGSLAFPLLSYLKSRLYSLIMKTISLKPVSFENDLLLAVLVYIISTTQNGTILIFLPGWSYITDVAKLMCNLPVFKNCQIIPLHSLVPTTDQQEVFRKPTVGMRKVILATNIAETSITIEDVVFVVDSGFQKETSYDERLHIQCLKLQPISKANASQRKGRAGRCQPGICFHLYSRYEELRLEEWPLPEMLRTSLEQLCLTIKLLGLGAIAPFLSKAVMPPSAAAVLNSISDLQQIGALAASEALTSLGHHLAKLPVDARIGKMLIYGAIFSCFEPVVTVAASLSYRDAFRVPFGKERHVDEARRRLAGPYKSDHIMLYMAYKQWACRSGNAASSFCHVNFLSQSTLFMLREMRQQLTELLLSIGFVATSAPDDPVVNCNSADIELVSAMIAAGLYPNIAKVILPKRRHSSKPVLCYLKGGQRCQLHPKSVLVDGETIATHDEPPRWAVYHLLQRSQALLIHDLTLVSPYVLLFFGGSAYVNFTEDYHETLVTVDDWVKYKCHQDDARLIVDLHHQLDKLIDHKVEHPGVMHWDVDTPDRKLLKAIRVLLAKPVAVS